MKRLNEILLVAIFVLTAVLVAVVGLKAYKNYDDERQLEIAKEEQALAEMMARNEETYARAGEIEHEIEELSKNKEELVRFVDEVNQQQAATSEDAETATNMIENDNIFSPEDAAHTDDASIQENETVSDNASQSEDTAIPGETSVSENATMPGEETISENATIPEEGTVSENTTIPGEGTVSENTTIPGEGTVSENTTAPGEASVSENTTAPDEASVSENTTISGEASVSEDTTVSGNASVSENAAVSENTTVSGNFFVSGNTVSSNQDMISGNATVTGNMPNALFADIYANAAPKITLGERRQYRTSMEETMEVNRRDKECIAGNQKDFSGLKIACLGDSITAAANLESLENYQQYAYPARLKELLGAAEVYNLGIGGSSIGRYWADPFVERYQEIPQDVDIIIVMGGTNDGFCVSNAELGTIEERAYRTFYGDLNELMHGLKEKYPDAEIFFATPLPNILHDYLLKERSYLLPQQKFADAVLLLSYLYGFNVIDLYNSNILDSHDADIIESYVPDGVHCNPAGYQILAEHFAAEIIRHYQGAEGNLETP